MRRVAVIGAGASGLPAIKCCLDEGLEPVCYERSAYIGGLWHYTEHVEEGQSCVMKSTVINTSKEMTSYSDYPIPAEFSAFMHNTKVDKYLNMYADEFDLRKHINLNTEVVHLNEAEGGKWELDIRQGESKRQEVFDAVLVCTGHHADKFIPTFPGVDKFKGKVVHTHDYKDYRGYEDKTVLIIGIGNSGTDVATELSHVSKQVYLSTRSGAWLFNKVSDKGNPADMNATTRFNDVIGKTFPKIVEKMLISEMNKRFDHAKFSLQPSYGPVSSHPTGSDELPLRIMSGSVIVKGNVSEFTETGVKFVDGTSIDNIDAVVMATGYIFGFPFIDKSVIDVKDNVVNLYKRMFPPHLDRHTLAVIGCFQPIGSILPSSEMQCRLATRVFKGLVQLPSRVEMEREIREKTEAMLKRYNKSLRHTMQVDYISFMDEIAELVGCKPDIKQLAMSDPRLAYNCFFGPATAYQYRLMGPGAWKGAREAILNQWERTYAPLKTRQCEPYSAGGLGLLHVIAAVVLLFIAYMILL